MRQLFPAEGSGAMAILEKPFAPARLLAEVHQALASTLRGD